MTKPSPVRLRYTWPHDDDCSQLEGRTVMLTREEAAAEIREGRRLARASRVRWSTPIDDKVHVYAHRGNVSIQADYGVDLPLTYGAWRGWKQAVAA